MHTTDQPNGRPLLHGPDDKTLTDRSPNRPCPHLAPASPPTRSGAAVLLGEVLCSLAARPAETMSFVAARAQHRRARKATTSIEEGAAEVLGALHRDGCVVLPNYVGQPQLRQMLAGRPAEALLRRSPEGTRTRFMTDAHRVASFAAFFADPLIQSVARGHLGVTAVQHRCVYQLRDHVGPTGAFETFFHMDSWKQRLKAFLFLTDVMMHNAPLEYLVGSHRGAWRWSAERDMHTRFRTDAESFIADETSQFLGCYWPHQIDDLTRSFRLRRLTCTVPAGTLVIFDGRGVHRVLPLREGRREILSSYWIVEGQHV